MSFERNIICVDIFLCLTSSCAASDRMKELSDVFSGATPLSRVEKNDTLMRMLHRAVPCHSALMVHCRIFPKPEHADCGP